MYLLVNVAVLFGRPEFYLLNLVARDAFRGIGYFEGRSLTEVYALFYFEDRRRLEAVKQVFERMFVEKLGLTAKYLVQVRRRLPSNFKVVEGVVET